MERFSAYLSLQNSFQLYFFERQTHFVHSQANLTHLLPTMAQPQNLQLPEGASAAFDKCDKSNQDLAKWLVYTIGSACPSAKRLCYEAMKAYNETHLHELESEWDEMGFAKPADDSAENVQAALDKHIATVERVLESQEPDPWNSHRLYPTGFVVIDGEDSSEKGVVVVHCDKGEVSGEWGVL